MKCLKCGKESKWEFCRECKEIKRNAGAMVSQNKKKLIKLLNTKWLTAQWFEKYILYSDNIRKYGRIYMEYQCVKEYKILTGIYKTIGVLWMLVILRSSVSIIIVHL